MHRCIYNDASMSHALAADSVEKCSPYYFQVKRKRAVVEIIFVKFDLDGNRQVVPSIYLRPARDARFEVVNAMKSSQFDQIVLIKKSWPWAHETHVPLDDAKQLWQFIQAQLPQDAADSCQI